MTGICIYTAPLKALSAEKFHDWSKGIFRDKQIIMLTGDTLTSTKIRKEMMERCEEADIVLCTSELLDSLTRNFASERYAWLSKVRLVIVDECHIIASKGRGDCVEASIMRFTQINSQAKIWLLSATAPNTDDFALWLSRLNQKPTHVLNSGWRPTTLEWHYIQHAVVGGYWDIQADKMNRALSVICHPTKQSEKFLVFVWDKNTGRMMSSRLTEQGYPNRFYNADLEYEDRKQILEEFETDALNIIISTPALAWGSVHEDAMVQTPYGLYRYGSLRPGMLVWSYDEVAQVRELDVVMEVAECDEKYEVVIELEDGTELITGKSHPIYIREDGALQMRRADELVAGMEMVQF